CMPWPRRSSTSKRRAKLKASVTPNGWAFCSIAKPPPGTTSGSPHGLRHAKLRQQASVEDVDYKSPRGLDRALFLKLAEGHWLAEHGTLLICGPAGVGMSWLAAALGHRACRDNLAVLYQRVPRLFADFA